MELCCELVDDVDSPLTASRARSIPPLATTLALLTVAIVTRMAVFGDPVAHVDDEFYLLTGHAMLGGQWPYVDIWDRKPIGLFLIYEAIAAIGGGHSVLATHLIATLFAAATAFVIARIAALFAPPRAALLAGATYLVAIPMFGGQAAQSPIFYNLFMAAAALLLMRAAVRGDPARTTRNALIAMLLCGLSITVKQIAFIEGAYFGLAFLFVMWRQQMRMRAMVPRATAMALIALAPTIAAFLVYSAAGRGDAFVFANFVSIFLKQPIGDNSLTHGFLHLAKFMPPIAALGVGGLLSASRPRSPLIRGLLLGWLVAAILGYLFVPYFFDHYALPMIVPLSIAAAPLYDRPRGWLFLALLTLYAAAFASLFSFPKHHRQRTLFNDLSAIVTRELRGGCLFVANGQTQLYQSTGGCRLTPYVFPDHLSAKAEAGATPVDQLTEIRRVFAQRPAVVVTTANGLVRRTHAVDVFIATQLRQHYRLVPTGMAGKPRKVTSMLVFSRRDR